MSHTNETTYAKLPQWVATDKPTWLGDMNQAMVDIDGGLSKNHNDFTLLSASVASAVEQAKAADTKATSALSTAETANNTAVGAANTAANADTKAVNAQNDINKLNLTIHENISSSNALSNKFGTTYGALYFDSDATRSVFKLYGNIEVTWSQISAHLTPISGYSGAWVGCDTGFIVKAPSTVIWCERTGLIFKSTESVGQLCISRGFAIGTNGHIYWPVFSSSEAYDNMYIWHPSSLFFAADFGNQPASLNEINGQSAVI